MTPARDAGGAATEATPEMVVAAWRVFRGERPGMLLGPGPGFAEAISAALAQRAVRPGEAAQHTLHCVLAPRFSRLLAIARRLRVKLDLAESIAGGEITEQEWKSQAEIGRLTRALAASERALAGARAVLRQAEWGSSATDPIWGSAEPACPCCGQIKGSHHFDGCVLAAELVTHPSAADPGPTPDRQIGLSLFESTADPAISDNGLAPKNSGEVTGPAPAADTGGDA